MRADDRAVSTTLAYVLALAITTLLVSGLFVAAGDFVGDERERVVRSELEVVGHTVAAKVEAADRLASANGTAAVAVSADLPERVGGVGYRIAVAPSGSNRIELWTRNPRVNVTVRAATNRSLASSTVTGGSVVVEYDAGGDLEVSDD